MVPFYCIGRQVLEKKVVNFSAVLYNSAKENENEESIYIQYTEIFRA